MNVTDIDVRHTVRESLRKSKIGAGYLWNRFLKGVTVDAPPVFIVGCGHSGTSLLLRVLGAHSRMYAIPTEKRWSLKDADVRKRMLVKFDVLAVSHGKRRWIEKTPNNIFNLDLILEELPEAKIIIMLRDGRDVVCSLRDRYGDFEKGLKRWVKDNRIGEEFWAHPSVHLVRHEDVITDFKGTVERTVEFLGEKFEESMLRYYEKPVRFYSKIIAKPSAKPSSPSRHSQYRNWQINQPIFDNRGRWKTEMSHDEKSRFKEVAGDMLVRYGYAEDSDW